MSHKKHFFVIVAMCWGCSFIISLLFACASLPPTPPLKERIKIAVVGVSRGIADQKVANMLVTTLVKNGYFIVIEQEKIDRIIEEQKFQLSGDVHVDPETAVTLGKLLDVQAIVKCEIVDRKVQFMPVVIGALAIYSVTATTYVVDVKTGKTIAAISESGKSIAGGVPVDLKMTSGGKTETKQDILGIQRSEEEMYGEAVRNAVEDTAEAIIKALYEKNKKFEVMAVDVKPNYKLDSLTKNIPDANYFSARAKVYYVSFNVVWDGVNRYLKRQGNIVTSNRNEGIVIVEKSTSDFRFQAIALVERVSDDSTKVTIKGFCYKYSMYRPPHQHLSGWEKESSDFCSEIALNGIKKDIRRVMEEAKK